jgi:hypothetical protein
MASIIENVLVAAIVASCAIFSAWRLMSPRLRLRTLDFLTPVLGRLGGATLAARLRSQTVGQLAAGCSACSHNKTSIHNPAGRRS